jgi:hypothetical protein
LCLQYGSIGRQKVNYINVIAPLPLLLDILKVGMLFNQGPNVKTTYSRRQISNTPRASQQLASFSSAFASITGTNLENLEPSEYNQHAAVAPLAEPEVRGERSLRKRNSQSQDKEGGAEKGRKRRNCKVDVSKR